MDADGGERSSGGSACGVRFSYMGPTLATYNPHAGLHECAWGAPPPQC